MTGEGKTRRWAPALARPGDGVGPGPEPSLVVVVEVRVEQHQPDNPTAIEIPTPIREVFAPVEPNNLTEAEFWWGVFPTKRVVHRHSSAGESCWQWL